MKRILFVFLSYFVSFNIQAQVPHAFSFQGVAFHSNGQPIASQNISVKAEILQQSAIGVVVYSERHLTSTNAYGLYSLSIGYGTPSIGLFSNIDWSKGEKFLSIAIDPDGGNNFTAMGVSQLLSVPYALFAGKTLDASPKIFVEKIPGRKGINLFPSSASNAQGGDELTNIYEYKWIDGTPKNIFIDYKNLPDNVNFLSKDFTSGQNFLNVTKRDTIYKGIFRRSAYFSITDLSVSNFSSQKVTAIFSTATEKLDSFDFDLNINRFYYDKCYGDIIGFKTLNSVQCGSDTTGMVTDSFFLGRIGRAMEVTPLDFQTVVMNDFLNLNKNVKLIFSPSNCEAGIELISYFDDPTIYIETRSFTILPDKTLRIELDVRRYVPQFNGYRCYLDYK